MRPVTPRGFRDVLFEEAAERRSVTASVTDVFLSYGFRFVETPALEEYSVLESAAGGSLEGTAFRMVDLDGSLLALRPEMTLPIARLAATRLEEGAGPWRLCYSADVYREHASLRGEARQFTQVGVELIGANGGASDAEIVCALVDALDAAGLADFTVGIGTVAVLQALIAAAGAEPEWGTAVLAAAHDRNLVELDRLSGEVDVDPDVGAALRRVVRIGGGREAIAACREITAPVGCAEALSSLEEAWELLEVAGATTHVRVDFGILRSFDYYTGLIIEAYAPGLGVPLGGGGRYDDVLAAFGRPMPAAGFALALERVMIALAAQKVMVPTPSLDIAIGGDTRAVMREAARLRRAGFSVVACPGVDGQSLADAAATAGADAWLRAGEDTAHRSDGSTLKVFGAEVSGVTGPLDEGRS